MADTDEKTIKWVESDVGFECKLNIRFIKGDRSKIFLTIPGVDGSTDGYKNKYLKITEGVNEKYGFTTYQMDNPYITSKHWESNLRRMLAYISEEHEDIDSIYIMAHSAGSWIISMIAWEYPEIKKLLLVNPATRVEMSEYERKLKQSSEKEITILAGEKDPSSEYKHFFEKIRNDEGIKVVIAKGVDHNFSGEDLQLFVEAPERYLFN